MSERYEIDPSDEVHVGERVTVDRYTKAARLNHWLTAACLVLLAISGLAMFHPDLFFLSALFGGGQNTRAIHPWIGVVLFFSFGGLFLRFWRLNLWRPEDGTWMRRLYDVLINKEDNLPELGKYNAGQKIVFWGMSLLILILIVTGLAIWNQYFSEYTTVEQKRYALILHSAAAVTIICVWIVHVYAAIWVKGTFSAMIQGYVTGGWAWKHHRKWLKALVSGKHVDDGKAAPAPAPAGKPGQAAAE
ncbi:MULTISPECIES: formate dehydrogenase subunit gamma [Rhodomicrobium]|uniref:formate dehydrogenase subunit gamma n=1 Tax=Rhodomicrobium TaxID=1068 RepID=UPI000B4B883B|nr:MULTISPECIES: formate dehydrogenase subunit gamma [Rhodomicrobium]